MVADAPFQYEKWPRRGLGLTGGLVQYSCSCVSSKAISMSCLTRPCALALTWARSGLGDRLRCLSICASARDRRKTVFCLDGEMAVTFSRASVPSSLVFVIAVDGVDDACGCC